jgi:tetratricopeptide (TPR) repeat protein
MPATIRLALVFCVCGALPAQTGDVGRYADDLRQADQLLSKGDFAAVIETLKPWPEKLPNRPEAYHFLGLAYYRLRDFPAAIRHLSAALDLESPNSDARKQTIEILGAAYYFTNQWRQAVPLLEQAVGPAANSDLLYSLAISYLFTGNSDGARRAFAGVFGIDPDSPQSYVLAVDLMRKERLQAEAENLLQDAHGKWPDFRGLASRLAAVATSKGDHARAATLLREEVKNNPSQPASWHALGEALLSLGQPADAAESLKRAIWLDPRATASYILLAKLYMDAGSYEVAEDTLHQALKTAPQSYEANFLLGRLYHKTARPELARKQLAIAEQISH